MGVGKTLQCIALIWYVFDLCFSSTINMSLSYVSLQYARCLFLNLNYFLSLLLMNSVTRFEGDGRLKMPIV